MAPAWVAVAVRDEESGGGADDSPASKRTKAIHRFPLSRWELAAAVSVFLLFSVGIFCISSPCRRPTTTASSASPETSPSSASSSQNPPLSPSLSLSHKFQILCVLFVLILS
ncbi:putative membrane protein-like [Iris pallida]|uniref:Membrane protein-like n=1 Tax=Iris pallida TaxID=29817 RepID=A0AAX6HWE9_IRIPA|nr:putative membrane protein-like [Iris pallida]